CWRSWRISASLTRASSSCGRSRACRTGRSARLSGCRRSPCGSISTGAAASCGNDCERYHIMKRPDDDSRCEEVLELLEAYLDGDLSPVQTSQLGEHLESCPACAAEL